MRKTVLEYRVPYADTDQMGVVYYGSKSPVRCDARELIDKMMKD